MIDPDKKAAFMAAVRGIPNHHVTKALNTLTPGTDWRNSTKNSMSGAYAGSYGPNSGYTRIDLELLRLRALARMNGDRNWSTLK